MRYGCIRLGAPWPNWSTIASRRALPGMSEHRLAAGALAAAAAFGVAVAVPLSEATHFSWLGHTPCAGDKCELVPAGFIAQGEFEPHTFTIPDEIESRPEERVERLLTSDGHEIARVSTAFRRQLDDAGSARLRDGRIVNVDEKVKGQFRYLVAQNAPFGLGAPGYRLVPYRTV